MSGQNGTGDAPSPAPGAGPTIRTARRDDIARLLVLEAAAFVSDRLERRNFRYAIASPSMAVMVTEDVTAAHEGTAVQGPVALLGYAMLEFRRRSRTGRLTSLAAATTGRGVGRALLAAAEAEATRRGCDRIGLEVRADNAPAIRLYERAGFSRAGAIPDFYEDGETALRLEKPLTG